MIDSSSTSPEMTWVHDSALHTDWCVLSQIDEIEQCVCAKLTVQAVSHGFKALSRKNTTNTELQSSVKSVRLHTGW